MEKFRQSNREQNDKNMFNNDDILCFGGMRIKINCLIVMSHIDRNKLCMEITDNSNDGRRWDATIGKIESNIILFFFLYFFECILINFEIVKLPIWKIDYFFFFLSLSPSFTYLFSTFLSLFVFCARNAHWTHADTMFIVLNIFIIRIYSILFICIDFMLHDCIHFFLSFYLWYFIA